MLRKQQASGCVPMFIDARGKKSQYFKSLLFFAVVENLLKISNNIFPLKHSSDHPLNSAARADRTPRPALSMALQSFSYEVQF
jgi:hypothetical protein